MVEQSIEAALVVGSTPILSIAALLFWQHTFFFDYFGLVNKIAAMGFAQKVRGVRGLNHLYSCTSLQVVYLNVGNYLK